MERIKDLIGRPSPIANRPAHDEEARGGYDPAELEVERQVLLEGPGAPLVTVNVGGFLEWGHLADMPAKLEIYASDFISKSGLNRDSEKL